MPIHGEPRHLVANGALAAKTGVPPERVLICEDGSVVDLHDGVARKVGEVPVGYVFVDGSSVGEIGEADLTDRRTLGQEGFIAVFAVVDGHERSIIAGPHIQARGMAEDDSVFDDILPKVTAALEKSLASPASGTYQMQQAMRRVIGRWAAQKLHRAPMIIPTVVEA